MSDPNQPERSSNMPSAPADSSEPASAVCGPADLQQLQQLVQRAQNVMAHGWMIRTFIKHCDEVEDFPELNEMARTIFDVFRAVETQINDPVAYFRTIRRKIGKLREAAVQFRKDAWHASTHTNFQQCAIAAEFLGQQLAELLADAERLAPSPAPPKITLPGKRSPQPQ